jgi:hypothetical protein
MARAHSRGRHRRGARRHLDELVLSEKRPNPRTLLAHPPPYWRGGPPSTFHIWGRRKVVKKKFGAKQFSARDGGLLSTPAVGGSRGASPSGGKSPLTISERAPPRAARPCAASATTELSSSAVAGGALGHSPGASSATMSTPDSAAKRA